MLEGCPVAGKRGPVPGLGVESGGSGSIIPGGQSTAPALAGITMNAPGQSQHAGGAIYFKLTPPPRPDEGAHTQFVRRQMS